MNKEFAEILGISPWMWLTLGAQLVIEGYGLGFLSLFTIFSVTTMLMAGMKLQMANDELTRTVYDSFQCLENDVVSGRHTVSEADLGNMQSSLDISALEDVEPNLWCNSLKLLETMIKFCMWQNSVSLTLVFYHGYYESKGVASCYYESRGIAGLVIDVVISVITILMSAVGVIPVYVLMNMTMHHKRMQKRRQQNHHSHGGHGGHGSHGSHGSHGGNNGHGGQKRLKQASHYDDADDETKSDRGSRSRSQVGKQHNTKVYPRDDEDMGNDVNFASWGR